MFIEAPNRISKIGYPPVTDIVIFRPEIIAFGGEERIILALSKELFAQGKPNAVLCYYDAIGLAAYADWPLSVYQLNPKRNPVNKALALRRCLKYLHKQGAPVPLLFSIQSAYHTGLAVSAPYHLQIPDTYSLLGYGKQKPTKNPFSIKGLKHIVMDHIQHLGTKNGIRKAHRFVTNTKALQREMIDLYGRSGEVIYLGGFGGPLTDRSPRQVSPIELLTVSRLQSSKRIDWILNALASIRCDQAENARDWKLHIVGSGPQAESLQQLSKNLGLGENVVFHGFIDDNQLNLLYERAHIFLIPARQGYGLPAIEALYHKLAVVLSDESGVVELLSGTDWVSISSGGESSFHQAVAEMMRRVLQPDFFDNPLPVLPTESGWAKRMITYLDW